MALAITEEHRSLADSVRAVLAEPAWNHDHLFSRCPTIAGGTPEIVRTQIAESPLGLPREPQAASGSSRARGGTS